MLTHLRPLFFAAGAVLLLVGPVSLTAQIPQIPYSGQYNRGLDIVPVFEGWMPNPDGTYSMYFGYFNRNYKEELDVPIGPDNNIDLGNDAGQPTHFYPRRHFFVFKVVVPKDWGPQKRVVWSLRVRGNTNTAKGWLLPDWEINNEVMMENAGTGNDPENERPIIRGSEGQTVSLPNAVTLTATAKDDGRPKPRRSRNADEGNGQLQGLSIRWIQYRGPGPVIFNPEAGVSTLEKSVTSTTKASFKVPGSYVLR